MLSSSTPEARLRARSARLVWWDYRAHYSYKSETIGRTRLLLVPRALTNGSVQACVLFRLATGGGRPLRGVARWLLLALNSCDIHPSCEIGPGLLLMHPVGIAIGPGVRIGRKVALFQNITLSGGVEVGDEVEIYTGAVLSGPIRVGRGAKVGAGVVADRDIEPGEVFTLRRSRSTG